MPDYGVPLDVYRESLLTEIAEAKNRNDQASADAAQLEYDRVKDELPDPEPEPVPGGPAPLDAPAEAPVPEATPVADAVAADLSQPTPGA